VSDSQLHQIIAVLPGIRTATHTGVTELDRLSKAPIWSGQIRTYERINDDAPELPGETQRVQATVPSAIDRFTETLTRLFDVSATREWGNAAAVADIVVDGQTLLSAVPVGYLMFLDKQLEDIHTYISRLPTLDPAYEWTEEPGTGVFRSAPARTLKTTKVERGHVLVEPTKEHPAQVRMVPEDRPDGYWTTVKLSGAIPIGRRLELLQRVETLQRAVKYAREAANSTRVENKRVASTLFGFLLAPTSV
jgi:phage gp46-like protein